MNKLRVLIADDEMPARARMKRMLEGFEEIEIVHIAENGLEALEKIQELKPDAVFLDIEMPGLNGLEVAANISLEETPHIVFATAFNDYAIKAFELNAIDYLLKPFNEERLESCIEKIQEHPRGKAQKDTQKKIQSIANDEDDLKIPFTNKIPVATHDRYKLLDYEDVICIEVEERSTLLYSAEKTYILNQTLDYFEKKLPTDRFLRINRSCIIGLLHVKEIIIWFGNRFKIVLTNGKEVISSREKSKLIKQVLKF